MIETHGLLASQRRVPVQLPVLEAEVREEVLVLQLAVHRRVVPGLEQVVGDIIVQDQGTLQRSNTRLLSRLW